MTSRELTLQVSEIQAVLLSLLTSSRGTLLRVRACEGSPEGLTIGSPGDLVVGVSPAALFEKTSGENSTEGWTQIAGSGVSSLVVDSSRAVEATDTNQLLLVESSNPVVITLGDEPQSFWCEVVRMGTGTVTFEAGGSTPIRTAGGALAITAQFSGVTVTRLADAWLVVGALS